MRAQAFLTIHNLAYQDLFAKGTLRRLMRSDRTFADRPRCPGLACIELLINADNTVNGR